MTETLNQEELMQKIKDLQAENQLLKKKQNKFGLTFKKYPENGEPQRLYAGEIPFLSPRPQYSVVKDTPQRGEHVLIEGDNLSALVALQATHKGKVDVIYIDPPYNTGNKDFVYNDRYVSNDDGFRHSKWLSFIERRLVLAKELLSETGVIFVSIDDNEQAALKLLMDGIFGQANFVGSTIWERAYAPVNLKKHLSVSHDFVLVYAKNSSQLPNFSIPRSVEGTDRYSNPDSDPRGPWASDNFSVGPAVSANVYEIITPSGRKVLPPHGYSWRFSETRLAELIADGRVWFGEHGKNTPRLKRFLSEVKSGVTPMTIWKHKDVGHSQDGTREVKTLFGGKSVFTYPKPTRLIARLVNLTNNPNAVILDFFAGSGTTGHAVAALNAEDGGNRQCILVTNNFEQDGSPNGIARDVTAARMKAVLTGQWADGKDHDALPGNLHYYQIEFAPQENEFRAVSTWADADHAVGLQAVKDSAFTKVDVSPADYPELADLITDGRAVLSANETTLFATWLDEMELNLGSELVESFAESAMSLGAQLDKKVVFYIPSSWVDDVPDEDFFAGAQAALTYPMPYLNTVNRAIKDLKSGGYLLPLDEAPADDSLGSEGIPAPSDTI